MTRGPRGHTRANRARKTAIPTSRKVRRIEGAILILLALGPACTKESTPLPDVPAQDEFGVVSTGFGGSAPMNVRYTCDGSDISPPLQWSTAQGAGEYVITLVDLLGHGRSFVHWVVWAIPPSTTKLEEGGLPGEAVEGTNDFGDIGYGGPCPPEGDEAHHYVLTVYAVEDGSTDGLEEGASAEEVLNAIACCTLAEGGLNGEYERP
jgi:Raf kinase inhibitor-like YbhB/YbcL family protein